MNPANSDLPHVVIVGAGFGGLDAAKALNGADVRVTVLDRHNYHLFQPLLYQVATASLSPGDIASPIRWVLRHQANASVLMADVRQVDAKARRVVLHDDSRIPYDYLILATGATHAYFGHPEWSKDAPGLKTLEDALEIRTRVLLAFEAAEREQNLEIQRRHHPFVIVGAGPTGVELAGALAEIARQTLKKDFRSIKPETARIILVEGSSSPLGVFAESLRQAALRSLERLGVEFLSSSIVTSVDEGGVGIGARRIDAGTVLWAAGVAASPLGASLESPLDRAGRVLVEPSLAVPGDPRIFVAGDLCALQQDGAFLPGVAQVAKQQGAHAAANVLLAIKGQPLRPFRYRDYGSMATIGRGAAVAQIRSFRLSGWLAWLVWLFVHIMSLIGFRNRVAVLSEWAWSYVTMQRRVRLITGTRRSGGQAV